MVPTLLAALMFLLGCKSDAGKPTSSSDSISAESKSASSTPVAAVPAPGTASAPLIVCFGDSLTAGLNIEPGGTYPDDLQSLLDAKGFHYRVVNFGISGETTKDGLARIDRVIARHPELVVVEFGGNDGLRGVPVSESRSNLMKIVGKLQSAGIKVALAGITLPPQFGSDYIHQFNSMFPAVAGKYHVPLLPFILQDVYGIQGSIQEDGIHPTAQGAKQVAVNVEKLITPMLRK
jgi:acyl-CoA thioesterase I